MAEQPQPQPTDLELIARHEDYLKAASEFLGSAKLSLRTPGDVVVLALAARVIQRAHAIQDMCARGYAGEAAALARAVLSGAVVVMVLVEPRKDGLARSFVESIAVSTKRVDRIGSALSLTPDQARELGQQLADTAAKNLEAFEGIESAKLDGNGRTWHGLPTERDLFAHVGMTYYYDIFYGTFSDGAHVGARALGMEAAEVQRGEIGFGPKWEPVWEPFFATLKCVGEVLAQLDLDFELARGAEIDLIIERFASALSSYADRTWGAAGPSSER